MLDPQPVNFYVFISSLTLIGFVAGMVWMHFHFRRNEKIVDALSYMRSCIATNEGSSAIAIAMLANALPRSDRSWAITCLVMLATFNGKHEAFLVLRDYIGAKDLRRVAKKMDEYDPKIGHRGDETGLTNGKKLICFATGTRTIEHLDADLTPHRAHDAPGPVRDPATAWSRPVLHRLISPTRQRPTTNTPSSPSGSRTA